ncbi:hypothetical protein LC048_11110 [Mesobacillus subterraneus]|uniref:hypothetical protein n=1 Tax=Mesobacillus subterraneus TaxID=285983 RepID=UPI001CFD0CC7|nr:hypothetical protein [Mesobacillus subterraneus]WLR57350.1 hypothetical protein LC048_11110 [Mesobacillus subterraneus]
MKDPIKIMLLGLSIMIVSLFIQNISRWEPSSSSSLVQIIFAVGFMTTLVGFFYKKSEEN